MRNSVWLRVLLGQPQRITHIYECRQCGTSVEKGAETCPYCGPTDVVEYKIT